MPKSNLDLQLEINLLTAQVDELVQVVAALLRLPGTDAAWIQQTVPQAQLDADCDLLAESRGKLTALMGAAKKGVQTGDPIAALAGFPPPH